MALNDRVCLSIKMYNVSVGPSKIVAKARRGIPQSFESYQNSGRRSLEFEGGGVMNGPKPIFHTISKKCCPNKRSQVLSPEHEELIRFISESWSKVCKEYESDRHEESNNVYQSTHSTNIMYYENREPNTYLQDFKPFDLESWWGKRLFNNITKSVP